jgi:ABC-type uncharacterized transport system auxiliary subunit
MKYSILLALLLTGCAYMRSTTNKYQPETGDLAERTTVRVYTFFDSKSQLTKFRNTTGQVGNGSNVWTYPSGTTIGSLNDESSSTNLANIFQAIAQGVATGTVKGMKP